VNAKQISTAKIEIIIML